MPQVRLRTIINQDNSTTFQVQFSEDGEWVDLTWEMISDKPFEDYNHEQFSVVDGILNILSQPVSSIAWENVTGKPFSELSNTDFTVVNGVLTYTGNINWSRVNQKPFSTVSTDDFKVEADQLKLKNPPTTPAWSDVQNKPFNTVDTDQFDTTGGELSLIADITSPEWSDVQHKPFSGLDNDTIEASGAGNLQVKKVPWNKVSNKPFDKVRTGAGNIKRMVMVQDPDTNEMILAYAIPDWNDVLNRPFNSLDYSDFSVDPDTKQLSVNFPVPTDPDWDDVESKPFETLNSTDFSVDSDGELTVNFPTPTPDDWDDVTNKPFETLNSSDFTVDEDGELSLVGGGSAWSDITSKPFSGIGGGNLYVFEDNLYGRGVTWMESVIPDDNKLNQTSDIRNFVKNFVTNSLKNKFGFSDSLIAGTYGLLLDECENVSVVTLKIDTTALPTFPATSYLVIKMRVKKLWSNSANDTFRVMVSCFGLPLYTDGSKRINIEGMCGILANKNDQGEYSGYFFYNYEQMYSTESTYYTT